MTNNSREYVKECETQAGFTLWKRELLAQYLSALEAYLETFQSGLASAISTAHSLNRLSPIEALRTWSKKSPELLVKRVYKQVELDTYQHLTEATEIMSTNIEEPLRKLKRLFHRYFKINPAAVLHKPEAWLERPPATSGSPELTTN